VSAPEATQTALLDARGVAKRYGHVTALRGVDFSLESGETHAIVGDNGAGKSTLVKILSGAIEPSEGALFVDGEPVSFSTPEDAFRAGISTVYQNLALVGCRNIAENLFLGKEPTRFGIVAKARMHREAAEMLAGLRQMNVRDTTSKVEDLSGGQRQAVAIARGMHQARRILILDEPTAALGVQESHEILNLIQGLKNERRSVLIVSHNLAHVFRVADRITVLRGGLRVGTVRTDESTPDEIVRMITGASLL
jgi:fructose transport system ATP-binding protein